MSSSSDNVPPIPPSGPAFSEKDQRLWAMLCHLSTLAGFLVPFGNIIGPLVVWLVKKDEYPLVNDQGKEALNFQLSLVIYFIVSVILCFVLIGIPILLGLLIFNIIMTIIAAVKANEGTAYRYPLTIRFLS